MITDDLRNDYQLRITDHNRIQDIKNACLQGETQGKDQKIAALQKRYLGYLANKDKNNGTIIIAQEH